MKKVLNVRVEEDVKNSAEEIFKNLGLTMSTGINIYLKQVAMKRAVPFELVETTKSQAFSDKAKSELLNLPRNRFRANSAGVMVPDGEISNSLKEWIANG